MSKIIILIPMLFAFSCFKPKAVNPNLLDKTDKKPIEISKTDLGAWTTLVLDWDESSRVVALTNLLADTHVNSDEFTQQLKGFIKDLSQSPLVLEKSWLNQKKPGSFTKNLDVDHGETFFAQKTTFAKDSEIIIIGDLHGSIHSLVRNLWRLVKLRYIDPSLKIVKKNTYIVFTGDFVDRGRYGIECIYTLMKIKSANQDRVFLLRGNHENNLISERYGLKEELDLKYGPDLGSKLFADITNFYQLLPVALFAEIKGQEKTILQFSHGGFGYDADKKQLLHSPKNLLNSEAFFEQLSVKDAQPYMWADFYQNEESKVNKNRGFDSADHGVSIIGRIAFEEYSQEILKSTKKPLAGIFRGHQDRMFGFKMLFKSMPNQTKMADLQYNNVIYEKGPFDWRDVVLPAEKSNVETSGLDLTNYRPVFTFTTAAEGQMLPFDTFGILKVKDLQKNYRLLIYDIPLNDRPERSYVTIDQKPGQDDVISPSWDEKRPGMLIWQ